MLKEDIYEAIARAWRHPGNIGEEVNVKLIDAIVEEISSVMSSGKLTFPDAFTIAPIGPEVVALECIREMQKQNAEILKLLDKVIDMPNSLAYRADQL